MVDQNTCASMKVTGFFLKMNFKFAAALDHWIEPSSLNYLVLADKHLHTCTVQSTFRSWSLLGRNLPYFLSSIS